MTWTSATPPRASRDLLDGTSYRFLRRIGEGAYGVVVEAEQVALRRVVVVKVLHASHTNREDVVDRLRLEAQVAAAIAPLTPHVVSVLELGCTPEGRPFLVMERLDGRSLKEEIEERGALPLGEAVGITAQLLEGLAASHDAGVLHRDVKPDNVFLTRGNGSERVVKLIDFGLAKLTSSASSASKPLGPSPLAKPTDDGVILGTPRFFAPEQARGQAASVASDLYSTGVVLYAMLTGSHPFPHCTNVYHLVRAHLTESPPPPSVRAPRPIPREIEDVVMQALAKRPEDRFPNARSFRAELLHAAARSRLDGSLAPADDLCETETVPLARDGGRRRAPVSERPATRRGPGATAAVAVAVSSVAAALVAGAVSFTVVRSFAHAAASMSAGPRDPGTSAPP